MAMNAYLYDVKLSHSYYHDFLDLNENRAEPPKEIIENRKIDEL